MGLLSLVALAAGGSILDAADRLAAAPRHRGGSYEYHEVQNLNGYHHEVHQTTDGFHHSFEELEVRQGFLGKDVRYRFRSR